MASKFLNNSNGVDLSALQDGTFPIYAKSIKVNDLNPNMAVGADNNKFLNSTNAGSGNMNYTGATTATDYIYKALTLDGRDATLSSIQDNGSFVTISNPLKITKNDDSGIFDIGGGQSEVAIVAFNGLTSNKVVVNGGTNQQYLMGDGSLLEASAQNGNANF